MSISSNLTKLTTDITNAYTSIENKGGTIPANKNTNNLSTAIDSIQSSNIIGATAEGESLSLTNTKAMPYSDYVVEGKSEQATGKSKNYFDASKIQQSSIVVTDNGKTIELPIISSGNGNINTNTFLKDLCPELNVGDVVYLNFTRNINPGKNNFIFLYNNTMSPPAVEWDNGTSKTIDQNLLDSYVILYGNKAQDGETQQIIITDFKIQKNKITPYSPYNQGTVTIKQRGKNLAYTGWAEDFVNSVNIPNQAYITTKDNKNCLRYAPSNGYGDYEHKNLSLGIKFKENTQYTISYDILKENYVERTIAFYYTDGTYTHNSNLPSTDIWVHQKLTSVAGKTVKYVAPFYTQGATYIDIDTYMINEGTEESPYEPYQGYDKVLQTEPLRSLPNGVKDSKESDGNHTRVGQLILDGTEPWQQYGNNVYFQSPNIIHGRPTSGNIIGGYCNYTDVSTTTNMQYNSANGTGIFVSNLVSYWGLEEATVSAWVSFVSQLYANGTPIIIQYELYEETIEPLTQNQATTMLDIIKTGSYEGTTNIYTDEDVKPTIGVGYYKYGETGGLPTVENEKLIFDKELQIDREELIF